MSNDIKGEILAKMRKDPGLFNINKKILSDGIKALGDIRSPSVVEFDLFGATYPLADGATRLMSILTAKVEPSGFVLSYEGMLQMNSPSSYDVKDKFDSLGVSTNNPRKLSVMIVVSGKLIRVYMAPAPGTLWAVLSKFPFNRQFAVDPQTGLIFQHLTDFCRQFANEQNGEDKTSCPEG